MAYCGAKTRAGGRCRRLAMRNGRCDMHGGKSTGPPKGNTNALKHGIYSNRLTPEEVELWDKIPIGTLEDEIKLCRLQLRRLLIAERKLAEGPTRLEGLELSEIRRSGSAKDGRRSADLAKRPDYHAIIDRLLGVIARLVRTHMELTGGTVDSPDETARRIQAALAEIEETSGPAQAA